MKNKNFAPKGFTRAFLLLGLFSIILLLGSAAKAIDDEDQNSPFHYVSPLPGANYVPPATTIMLRSDQFRVAELLEIDAYSVRGSKSGLHTGDAEIASDGRTIIFRPHNYFTPGESVQVTIKLPDQTSNSQSPGHYTFAFTVTEPADSASELQLAEEIVQPQTLYQSQAHSERSISPSNYLTAPSDIPPIVAERWPGEIGEGYIFVSTFNIVDPGANKGYMLILDNDGEPVYYANPFQLPVTTDFKKQPNGLLTYFAPFNQLNKFFGMNEHYEIVDEYEAGNGYPTDLHDLQLLEDGNALLLIHDLQTVDMSELVPGGNPEAPVIGCVVQEIDEDKNVVFQWRSWDYIDILDTNRPLDFSPLRYIHCNSIMQDFDGNLLMSSRHLDEITKIDRRTGEIIWRLGGRHNDFEFISDYGFNFQHDARRLPNGRLTIYDNGVVHDPQHSRGVEYVIDENNKIAVKVAEFRNTPDTFALTMGNMQTLLNGNVVVGWGNSSAPVLTEFDRVGNKILELSAEIPFVSYRAFRFAWQGDPTWPPVLVTRLEGNSAHLHFSWNGSTETVSYKIFAGRDRDYLSQLTTVYRDGFETTYSYDLPGKGVWYFQVIPLNSNNVDGIPSNIAYVVPGGESSYVPLAVSP